MLTTKNILIKIFWMLLIIQSCSKVSDFAKLESDYGKFNFNENMSEKNQYFVKQKTLHEGGLCLCLFSFPVRSS